MSFYDPEVFIKWYREISDQHDGHYLYLIDQEFTGYALKGMELIEKMHKQDPCFLVTTHSEHIDLQNACERLDIKLIPKNYVFYMPLDIIDTVPDILLLAKDHFLGEAWKFRVGLIRKKIKCYYSISNFMSDLRLYSEDIKIFITSEFSAIAFKAFSLGYKDITLLTYESNFNSAIDGVKMASKDFDFDLLK
jgi:hypothetical protein